MRCEIVLGCRIGAHARGTGHTRYRMGGGAAVRCCFTSRLCSGGN